MVYKFLVSVFFVVVILITQGTCIAENLFGKRFNFFAWCYNNETCDESTDFWGKACEDFSHQSPVDLPADMKSIHAAHEHVTNFSKHEMTFPSFDMIYLGNTILVQAGKDEVFYFERKIHRKETISYRFWGFDLHWGTRNDIGAEHTVGGKSYGGEVHLLFYDEDEFDPQLAERLPKYKGQKDFLVMGIFMDVEHDGYIWTSNFLKPILENLNNISTDDWLTVNETLNLTGLFRGSVAYRYPGSFTAPSCREVEWWVFRKPVVIPKEHIKRLRAATVEGQPMEQDNFRRQRTREAADVTLVKLDYTPEQPSEAES